MNVFMESRGESPEAQGAVAAVTINRAKSEEYSNTICSVVYSHRQFSWTNHNKNYKIRDIEAFNKARTISKTYLNGKTHRIGKRLYFNEKRLGKKYNTPYKPIVIGKLMFY
jgi:spore germination cell wall hydrolase CwlJ-like protein